MIPKNRIHLSPGAVFGKWTVLTVNKNSGGDGKQKEFWCRCVCGNKVSVGSFRLRSGRSKQCVNCQGIRHGHAKQGRRSKLYRTWDAMIERCCNSKSSTFIRYGAKGITICPRWRTSFEAFAQDIGEPPSDKHQIDRINNAKGYSPTNCRWATRVEQARNKSNSTYLKFRGQRKHVSEWAEISGIMSATLKNRLKAGWTIEKTLTTPVLRK